MLTKISKSFNELLNFGLARDDRCSTLKISLALKGLTGLSGGLSEAQKSSSGLTRHGSVQGLCNSKRLTGFTEAWCSPKCLKGSSGSVRPYRGLKKAHQVSLSMARDEGCATLKTDVEMSLKAYKVSQSSLRLYRGSKGLGVQKTS